MMRTLLWRSLLLAMLLPFAAAALADPAERFASARQLMHDGKLDAALAAFELLRADYPEDVDYAFARAQVLVRLGRDAEAAEQLDAAIAMAPAYEDIWRARYRLLARQEDGEVLDAFRRRAAEQFPAATWWHAREPESRPAWTVLVGAGADSLSNDLPGWDNQFIETHYERDDGTRYTGRVARDARNDEGDISIGLGGEWRVQSWFAGAGLMFVADPAFQARTGFEVYAGRSFDDGWGGTVRYRRRDYDNATIGTVVASVEKYVSDFRVAYTLGVSHLQGASTFSGHTLTGNWYYRDSSSVGVSLSGGREAEAIGGGRVIETDVRGISLSGRHQLDERLGLHWWLGLHDQGDLYRRRFVGMAVSIRF